MTTEAMTDGNTRELARSPFDALYGLRIVAAGDSLEGRLEVAEHHRQVTGIVHGGVLAAIGEAIASEAANLALAGTGRVALGMTNTTSFARPATGGELRAVPRVMHRGRTTWIVDVTVSDHRDQACSFSRVTLALRDDPRRPSAA